MVIYPKVLDGMVFGCFVLVECWEDHVEYIPQDLLACIQYAKNAGCDWLMLDYDAAIVEDLQNYD